MKKHLVLAVLSVFFALTSCDKEEETELPNEFTVYSYSSVSVNGQVKVLFSQQSSLLKSTENSGEFTVKINSNTEQRKRINIKSEDGVLTITADSDIQLSDNVTIELSTSELDEIRLESDQEAEFIGVFNQEKLNVVTEARSKLSLFDVKINNLTCRTEGESEFNLTTHYDELDGNQTLEESSGEAINDTTLLVGNWYILTGDSVTLEDGIWIVYGEKVTGQYQMASCDFVTQGETNIDAEGAPSKNINIKLEGQSQAKVWAFESITGKGEGESILYYKNIDDIDTSGFSTFGSAQILPLQ